MTGQDNEAGKLNAVPLVPALERAIMLEMQADDIEASCKAAVHVMLNILNARGLLTLEGVQALQMMKEGK